MRKFFIFFILAIIFTLNGTNVKAQTYVTTGLYVTYGCTSGDQFTSFYFGTISQASITCPGVDGYNNFTSISTNFLPGSSYTVTGTIGYSSNEYCKIWIDFNNDGNFDNTTELIYANTTALAGSINASIPIPLTATPGTHRMRVRLVYANTTFSANDLGLLFGCANDYTVVITSLTTPYFAVTPGSYNFNYAQFGSSSAPKSFVVTGANLNVSPGGGVITFTAPTGFQVASTLNGVYGNSTTKNYTGTTFNDSVYVKFTPLAANTPYSGIMTIIGGGATYNASLSGTSQLIYCASASNYITYDNISNVSFGGINNPSGPSQYSNYTATVAAANIIQGVATPLAITISNPLYPSNSNFCKAWIDYNQDGVFDDLTELVYNGNYTAAATLTSNISIPYSAVPGPTRMRIICHYYTYPIANACWNYPTNTYYYGETEDYTINVIQALPCVAPTAQPTSLTLTPSFTSIAGIFASASGTDHYLVVRSTSNSLTASPVYGTSYTAGQSLGNGTIVGYQTGTSFNDINLNLGTQYYYFVFGANSLCLNGPAYNTAALTGNATTSTLANALNGLYTINSSIATGGTNFNSFTAAGQALALQGVSGPVTFNVATGTYTEHLDLGLIVGATSTNTITFQSANNSSSSVTLQYNAATPADNYVIRFNGSQYITVKAMTLQATNATNATTVTFANGCNNISVLYNTLIGSQSAYTDSNQMNVRLYYGSNYSNITIDHNVFTNGGPCLHLYTPSGSNPNFIVTNNTFTNAATNNNNCVKIARCDGINFGNNTITVVAGSSANCLWYDYLVGLWKIHDNKLINLGSGIGLSGWYANTGNGVGSEALVYNNYVYTVGSTWNADLCGQAYVKFYYNTFVGSSTSATFHFGTYYGGWSNVTFENNIVYNTGVGQVINVASASGTGANPVNLFLDYNDYYTSYSSIATYLASSSIANLAALQTADAMDLHSLSVNPNFVAVGDLHVNNVALIAGLPIAGITTDIDGQSRAGLPTIGADELPPCVSPTSQASAPVFSPSYLYLSATFSASPDADHYLVVRSTASTLTTMPVNGTYYTTGMTLGNGTIVDYTAANGFSDFNLNYATQYYYFIFAANSLCSGGPLYLLTNPLTQSVNTLTPATIHSIASGLWSDPNTWSTGTLPDGFSTVYIDSLYTVHLDMALDSCFNLIVNQGGTLDATGKIGVLNIQNGITNNGIINLYSDTSNYANITFWGNYSGYYNGTGTNNINRFTFAKTFTGNINPLTSPILDINLNNLTVRGSAIDTMGILSAAANKGIIKFSGNFTLTTNLFDAAAYTIPATAGYWLNAPNFTVRGQAADAQLSGCLLISQGTYNIGQLINNTLTLNAASIFAMDGGAINATGRIYSSTAGIFTMSNGTMTVSTVGNTLGTGSFEYLGGNTTTSPTLFTISGGTIIVQNANSGTGNKIDVRFPIPTASNYNVTGGTLQLGNALTQNTVQYFCIDGKFWNVVVNNTTAQHGTKMYAAATILNNFTNTGTGASYLGYGASGYALTLKNNFSTNGQILGNVSAASGIVFNGTTAQTFSCPANSLLGIVTMNNTSGVSITPAYINYGLNLVAGTLNCATGTVTFGDSTVNTFTFTKGFGNITTSTAPVFKLNNMTANYILNDTVALTGTAINNLLPPVISGSLTLNNAKGLTLTKNLKVGTLALTSGMINTSTSVLTVTNTTAAAITGYSATKFINGTLARALPPSVLSSGSWVFPVGTVSAAADTILYNPFTIVNPSAGATTPYVKVKVMKGNYSAIPGQYMLSVNTDRRWYVVLDSGIFNYSRITVYDTNISTTKLVGRSASATGTFDGMIGTYGTFTFTSKDSLTAIAPYYYAVGNKNPMAYVSSTSTQSNVSMLTPGTLNQQIMGFQIVTLGSANPLVLSQINFNANGTTNLTDITNVRLYSTGTTNAFATTTVIDSTMNISSGSFSLNPSSLVPFYLTEGTNYFWVTYDIDPNAINNNVVDAQCLSITVDGVPRTPAIASPYGNRKIFLPTTTVLFSANFDETNFKIPTDIGWTCPQTGNWEWHQDSNIVGWTNGTGAYTPTGALSTPHSARYHSYSIATSTPLGEFISPTINCSANPLLKKYLEFYLIKSNASAGSMNLYISYDNGATWSSSLFNIATTTAIASWTKYTVNLDTTTSSTVKLKFTPGYYSSAYGDIGLDQISMYTITSPTQNYLSSGAAQPVTAPILAAVSNQQVLSLKVVTQYSQNPLVATSFDLNTLGTTNALTDIDSAKIYYTANNSNFATTNLFGTYASPNGGFIINGIQSLSADTNYFWLVYNIKSTSTEFNVVDAQFNSVTISGVANPSLLVSPIGTRTIRKPFNGTYTINNLLPTSGSNYNNFYDAVNDLNSIGATGPTLFNVSAGQTFSMPTTLNFTYKALASTPITFKKNGAGNSPVLAFTGTSGTSDNAILFNGASYITLDGFRIVDAGSSSSNYIERGIALYPSAAANINAHITIQNCAIQMIKANTSSYCIYQYYGSGVPPTGSGTNDYIHFYNDSLINSNSVMYHYGYSSTVPDKNLEIANCNVNNIGGNASTVYVFYSNYTDSLRYYNNTITNVTNTTALYGGYFYYPMRAKVYNNTISTITNTSTLYLFYFSGTNTNAQSDSTFIYGNKISGITNSSTTYGFYMSGPYGTTMFYNNEVSNTSQSGTSYIYPIYCTTTTLSNVNIFKNKVFNIKNTGTGSTYGAYIYNSTSGAFMNIYDNMWYDISCPASTSSNYAVYCGSPYYPMRFYNNTIFVNYTSTASANIFYGIYLYNTSSYSGSFDMRNNIIEVKPNMTNGTRSACVYTSTASPYYVFASSCNNNILYAGTPSAKNLIFYDGTNSDQTITAFKTRMAPREVQSSTEDVPFVSTTAGSMDVHIKTNVVTKAESHGQRITTPIAITTDFDNEIRQGETGYVGTGVTPDIGADEFNGMTTDDDMPPIITYTPIPNQISSTGATLNNVSISDPFTGVNVTTAKPRIYFKKFLNANTYVDNTNATNGWKYFESAATTSPFNYTLDFSKIYGGVNTGDTIMYFMVAQDNATPINIGGDGAIFTLAPTSTNLLSSNFPVTAGYKTFNIAYPVSGTYYVGAGQPYTNLSGAAGFFNYVNNNIVTGEVTAKIVSNITETGTITLNQMVYNGVGNYKLTIAPIDTATAQKVLSGGSLYISASNVVFDGSINGAGIWMQYNYASPFRFNSGANNCTIKNMYIKGQDYQSTTGYAIYNITGGVNNLTLINDSINNYYYGIYFQGTSTNSNNNFTIKNTYMGSNNGAWKVHTNALNLSYLNGLNVDSCTFNVYTYSTNTATPKAILLGTNVINVNITRNTFIKVQGQYASGNYGATGIEVNTANAASNITIANNVINNVLGSGTTAWTSYAVAGIKLLGTTGGVNIYNNSISMYGLSNQFYTTGSTQQYNAGIYLASTVTNLDVRNNIIKNTITSSTATSSRSYAIWSDAPKTAFTNIDYNDYYVTGTQGVLGYLGTDTTTLIGWRNKTSQDVHSLFKDPIFSTTNNRYALIPSKCPTSPAIAAGTPIAAVTTDIISTQRSQLTPTIGAYELSYAKKLNVSAVMQEYYNNILHGLPMTQTLDMDMNTGDMFTKYQTPIVDLVQVQIINPIDLSVEYQYDDYNLNMDGTITPEISLPSNMTGYRYIVINHRNSIETWSDSVDFSCLAVDYNFYTHAISTQFPSNMFADSLNNTYYGSLIWGGDVGYDLANPSRDGIINIFDLSSVFDAINDPSGMYSAGYIAQDLNGDGVVNIYDLSLVFDNLNAGASSINPNTMKKKK